MIQITSQKTKTWLGSAIGILLLVIGLWIWHSMDRLALNYQMAGRPAAMCFRYIAVFIAAMGEVAIVWLVIGNIWTRDRLTRLLLYLFGAIGLISLIGAITLGLAG